MPGLRSSRSSSCSSLTSSYFSASTGRPSYQASGLAPPQRPLVESLNLQAIEAERSNSCTFSNVSELRERAQRARSSVTVTSASKVTGQQTNASFPAQACTMCGYNTFQGDKFCGGCGGRLLTRAECEEMAKGSQLSASHVTGASRKSEKASRSALSAMRQTTGSLGSYQPGLAVPSNEVYSNVEADKSSKRATGITATTATRTSSLSAPSGKENAGQSLTKPKVAKAPSPMEPKLNAMGLVEHAQPEARVPRPLKKTRAESMPTLPTVEEPRALEEKLAEGPKAAAPRKRSPRKKIMGRKSINSWLQRENWIGTEWTKLMRPRKDGPDGVVVRSFNPPEPLLGRAPKDGDW